MPLRFLDKLLFSDSPMFRWLLKPKFYSKCISDVNSIKTRLETIKNKKRSMHKFLKKNIEELLRRGLDYDAYKRAQVLLFEENMLSCYELIEDFIGCISDHLEDLTKQNDCPEECKEAVPSLMYAAARVSDLPELRHLRTLFSDKFANSLEPYTSKELVKKLRRDPPTREMKIRVLYDIAQELSIEWDAKTLMQRLYTHPSLHEERPNTNGSKGKDREMTSSLGRKDLKDRNKYSNQDDTSSDTSSSSSSSSSINHGRKSSSSSSFGSNLSDEDEVETKKKPNSFWTIPPPYFKLKGDNSKGEEECGPGITTSSHDRGTSFPTSAMETLRTSNSKGHTHSRTTSLETQIQQGRARHVQRSIPDYDDVVARLKALRGRSS